MGNPLFEAMRGQQSQQNPMMQSFTQFMQQMRGKDPHAMIDQMVRSGQISQAQLDQAQQQAQRMSGFFNALKGNFGF